MSTRGTIATLLEADSETFRTEVESVLADHEIDPERVERADADLETLVEGLTADDVAALSPFERERCRRLWVLDSVPLGLTLAGPVYQDNPILYATRSFRELTGYSLAEVRGENLRLLQGPDTEPGPVDALREALDIWESTTVELWNYRADGSRFRNRVTLVPLSDGTTIANWVGIQERVE